MRNEGIVFGEIEVDSFCQHGNVCQGNREEKGSFTLFGMDRLQDALRRRDFYVEASERWGDTRAKLLHGDEWAANRFQICCSLGHPTHSDNALEGLTNQLDVAQRLGPIGSRRMMLRASNSRTVSHINKTIYPLNYVDDEDYRRQIPTQLSRSKGRPSVARAIC